MYSFVQLVAFPGEFSCPCLLFSVPPLFRRTIGPGDNETFFDAVSDPRVSISAINGDLGWLPPDPAFGRLSPTRPKFVIPWMEDDTSLGSSQLWVNRTLEFAKQAHACRADGLIGLTWRTWEVAPQVAALAYASWSDGTGVSLTDRDFFADFCVSNFGGATAQQCTALFLSLDSFSADYKPGTGTRVVNQTTVVGSKLPRDGQTCCGGGMEPVHVPAASVLDVSRWESWLATVVGSAHRERAAAWVSLFRYHRQTQVVSNTSAALNAAMAEVAAGGGPVSAAAIAAAQEMKLQFETMMAELLAFTNTPGELGMLAAHSGANWPSLFGQFVNKFTAPPLSMNESDIVPRREFQGTPRIYRPAIRTVVSGREQYFRIQAAILSAKAPAQVRMVLGNESHAMVAVPDERTGKAHSQVYAVEILTPQQDFAYAVVASFADGTRLTSPASGDQSVVVVLKMDDEPLKLDENMPHENKTAGVIAAGGQMQTQASQLARTSAGACTTSAEGCHLNGDCVNGRCRCDSGWRGSPSCGVLALGPVDKTDRPGIHNTSAATWGASPIMGPDGKWHAFHAQISRNCSVIQGWLRNSFIARSVSTAGVGGPYTFERKILPEFAHNPEIRQLADGSFLMFLIGGWRTTPCNCSFLGDLPRCGATMAWNSTGYVNKHNCSIHNWTKAPTDCGPDMPGPTADGCGPDPLNGGCGIAVAHAAEFDGPWEVRPLRIVDQWDSDEVFCGHTNPSPALLPNGSIVIAFNGGCCNPGCSEEIGTAVSHSGPWGPWHLLSKNSIFNGVQGGE